MTDHTRLVTQAKQAKQQEFTPVLPKPLGEILKDFVPQQDVKIGKADSYTRQYLELVAATLALKQR